MTSIAQCLQAIDSRTSDAINPCTSFVYRTPVAAGASGTANPTLSSTTQWVTFSVVLKHV